MLQISIAMTSGVLSIFVMSALVLGAGIVHAAPSDEEPVRTVVYSFQEAWNRHDMEAFGALFAPDAEFVNVTGVRWRGRKAIQLNHAFLHGVVPMDSPGVSFPKEMYGIFKTLTISFKQIDVRLLRNDVAVVHCDSEAVGDPRTKNPRHAVPVMILTQEGRHWMIAVVQNTEIKRTVK